MKKLATLFLISMAFACSKKSSTSVEAVQPKLSVTIVATSESQASIDIPSVVSESFSGSYHKTFSVSPANIAVYLHSEVAGKKSITIYVNDDEVAHRNGNCLTKDYDLSYDLRNY